MILQAVLLAGLALQMPGVPTQRADCAKMPRGKPYALVLSTKTPRVIEGPAPRVEVTLINCSGKALDTTAKWWEGTPLDTNYTLTITDQGGKRLQPNVNEIGVGANALMPGRLDPGRSYTEQGDLSMQYRFDEPGRYRVQVTRRSPPLKSNVLTITVMKPPGPTAKRRAKHSG